MTLSLSCLRAVVFVFALGLVAARPAHASTVIAFDLPALTRIADRVVLGEVLGVTSAWDAQHRRIYTEIEVQVAESWKGDAQAERKLLIVQPGGRVGDIEMRVHGLATFRTGDRAVLFLAGPERASAVVGMGQGMRRLQLEPGTQRWMALGGDRSAAVLRGRDGRLLPAPPEPTLPLETLRDRVRALVTP